ncbi:MAG: carbohydrate-binding domain-containing protein, partial [Turicibacter sp.]|nr:carbohydrate-binding domain-containing protein [Turicibacter sp.]
IISSGDDGIHADTTLEINGGTIDIKKSYEGLESVTLTINDGNIHLTASDDGMNAAGGNDNSAMNNRPVYNHFSSGNGMIYLNGGYVYLDATGDGIDANGSIEMSGGIVIVNGPTNGGNGILDYDSNFDISGGLLIGAGSSEMLQTPSTSSTQNTMVVNTNLSNGTLLNIKDKSGNNVLTFTPSKSAQCIIISSPNLKAGETYTISTGGSSTGTELDGLYTGGSYSGGAELTTLTLSNTVTTYGVSSGMNNMGGGMLPPSNPMHR